MRLLQIVPGFGHVQNGLFDYARTLENELINNDIISFYNVREAHLSDVIFLNYSAYGYQKRGFPIWLYLRLRRIVKARKIPLFVYFHELYAGGTLLTNSSFWLYPFQRKLCHLFLELSRASFCGNEVMMELLQKGVPKAKKKVFYAALFSNIPVLKDNLRQGEREKKAVVFGSSGRREEVYKDRETLERVCLALGIKRIIDIGNGDMSKYWVYEDVSVEAKGVLMANEVASAMQSSTFGFLSYVEHLFGKSGIFAAFAGNGLVTINFNSDRHSPKDGLVDGIHYVNSWEVLNNDLKIDEALLSGNIFSWYQARSVSHHAKVIFKAIMNENK